mmetsp:Transcript_9830/g.18418  ORF Transcript_9830/g.18418 Transcript_9830/m.18418 type:complete len:203 (+) Transcript_9830:164-772(+)
MTNDVLCCILPLFLPFFALLLANSLICNNPSRPAPMSRKTPKAVTLRTVPTYSSPTCNDLEPNSPFFDRLTFESSAVASSTSDLSRFSFFEDFEICLTVLLLEDNPVEGVETVVRMGGCPLMARIPREPFASAELLKRSINASPQNSAADIHSPSCFTSDTSNSGAPDTAEANSREHTSANDLHSASDIRVKKFCNSSLNNN